MIRPGGAATRHSGARVFARTRNLDVKASSLTSAPEEGAPRNDGGWPFRALTRRCGLPHGAAMNGFLTICSICEIIR
jgi:hypothetical protein